MQPLVLVGFLQHFTLFLQDDDLFINVNIGTLRRRNHPMEQNCFSLRGLEGWFCNAECLVSVKMRLYLLVAAPSHLPLQGVYFAGIYAFLLGVMRTSGACFHTARPLVSQVSGICCFSQFRSLLKWTVITFFYGSKAGYRMFSIAWYMYRIMSMFSPNNRLWSIVSVLLADKVLWLSWYSAWFEWIQSVSFA